MMELRTDRFKFKKKFPDKARKFAQKLHIKADEIEFVRKGIPINPKDIEIKEGERAAIRLITTPHLDRDSEILVPHGAILDDFRQSPSVLFGHDYRSLPIGHDQWIKVVKEGILAKTAYANHQFAEDVFQCVKHKDLNSNSVGFIPVETVKPEDKKQFAAMQDTLEKDYGIDKKESGKAKNIYTKWIMLEHSDVPVASNAQSLNLAVSKGEVVIKTERLKKQLEIEVVKDVPDKVIEVEWVKGEKVQRTMVTEVAANKEIEAVIEKDGVEKIEGVKAAWVDEKEVEIEKDVVTKPEVDIEEATKEITELLVIEYEDGFVRSKVNAFSTKYKLNPGYHYSDETHLIADFEKKYNLNVTFDKDGNVVITKPETTEVKEPQYKERWNKSLSKLFDIVSAESSQPMRFHYDLYEKFLECKVKHIFQNSYVIPSPLMGSYLAGFKEILGKFDLKDTRRFGWGGDETPPDYEVVNLNSKKSDDFLIDGMQFYEAEKKPLVVNYSVGWSGITIMLITSTENKKWNKDLLDEVHDWVHENNFLRGEKFSLSGEFLKEPGDSWDNLILKDKYKDAIMTSANALKKKGKKLVGRGLLFIGPPGTGKTKTGRVLMNELDATFIWISSRDFKCIGALRALSLGFSMARDLAPSVLFLEDIDTWLRGDMEFVTDLLKTEMDGIKQNRGMITIMTSNYPEKLPPALLDRPGRFHHIINFELPDDEQRKEMIMQWAGNIDENLLDELIEKTEGFSGAHLKELVEFAKMIAEEEDIKIGDAMLRSLDKLMEQRELIDDIRANKVDAKSFWGRIKLVEGKIQVSEEIDSLRDTVVDELNEVKVGDREAPLETGGIINNLVKFDENTDKLIAILEDNYKERLLEKDDHIADLKAGRVLSRKNRNVVKDAVTALNAVLKADATGTQEDEDVEDKDDVTERTVELEKDGDTKTFAKKDIELLIENLIEKKAQSIIEKAFETQSNPIEIKKRIKEGITLELDKMKGKVR